MCADASFLCVACGGLVREARREAHETLWCPSLKAVRTPSDGSIHVSTSTIADSEEDDEDSDLDEKGFYHLPVELRRLTSSQYEPVLSVDFSFAPGCTLNLEQQMPPSGGLKADHDTGGQLWWSELVLAEYLVESRRHGTRAACSCSKAIARPEASAEPGGLETCGGGHEQPLRALALGCGAAPASCFVAAALGWDVLLTDLEEVLPMTNRNLVSNIPLVAALGRAAGREGASSGRMATAALAFGQPLSATVRKWAGAGGISLVLCSDLIWEAHRHKPLAATLAELLAPPLAASDNCEVLVAYQRRQLAELDFFSVLPHYGLTHERLDVSASVRRARFSKQLLEQIRRSGTDSADWFFVHRVWRPLATGTLTGTGPAASAATKMRGSE
mmetsp:Transcript_67335/g.128225  ORF Transcript_67335/g.128225 Transcript_67335/m.128225 type:complete len:388 (+) Transcript_67335:65-1228(+)